MGASRTKESFWFPIAKLLLPWLLPDIESSPCPQVNTDSFSHRVRGEKPTLPLPAAGKGGGTDTAGTAQSTRTKPFPQLPSMPQ